MKILLALAFLSVATCHSLLASTLPTLNVTNWLSYHAVSINSHHAFAIRIDGNLDLFFMNRNQRTNLKRPIKCTIKIERKAKSQGSKWISRNIRRDGFINPPKAAKNPKKVTLQGTVTGDIPFQIDFIFRKSKVLMKASFLEKPKDLDKADYRMSLIVDTRKISFVTSKDKDDARAIRDKTRRCSLKITARNGKSSTVRFHEKFKYGKLKQDKITALELRSDKIGRKKLFLSLANLKQGYFTIEPKSPSGMIFDGFKVFCPLIDREGKQVGSGIILDYK